MAVRNTQRKVQLETKPLQRFAVRALRECLELAEPSPGKLRHLEQVTVVLVSDRRMSELHQQFLQVGGPTDVITFEEGDLFISAETAQTNAVRFRTSTEDELRLYIIHGLLHLHGFDDTTAGRARVMERTQQRILRALRERA